MKIPTPEVLKLQVGRWYGMQVFEESDAHPVSHSSPIRIAKLKVHRYAGVIELELEFFHAFYPPGVQQKNYSLTILFHAKNYLLSHCPQRGNRCIWIGVLTAEWLKPLADERLARAIELEPNLDVCLDRFFNQR